MKNSISEFDDDGGRIAVNLDVGEDMAEFTSRVASVWNQIPMEKKRPVSKLDVVDGIPDQPYTFGMWWHKDGSITLNARLLNAQPDVEHEIHETIMHELNHAAFTNLDYKKQARMIRENSTISPINSETRIYYMIMKRAENDVARPFMATGEAEHAEAAARLESARYDYAAEQHTQYHLIKDGIVKNSKVHSTDVFDVLRRVFE